MKNPYAIFLEDYLIEYHHLSHNDLKKPFHCLNPEHKDEHPSMHVMKNKTHCHCFACGKTYDLIGLVMEDKECSFEEALTFLHEKYKDQLQDKEQAITVEKQIDRFKPNRIRKIGKYELNKTASEYLKSRGVINSDFITTLFRLNVKNNELIIPHIHLDQSNDLVYQDYIARYLNPNAEIRYRRPAGVNSTTFSFPYDNLNKNYLFKKSYDDAKIEIQFVTEGEIDMASLLDLKKEYKDEKVNGIAFAYTALSSTGNINKYLDLIGKMEEKRKSKTLFVLCLDNDNAGKQTSDVLKGFLLDNSLLFCDASNIYKGYKDINEAIQKNRENTQTIFNETLNKLEEFYYHEKGKLYLDNYIENGKITDSRNILTIPFLHCTTFRLNQNGKPNYQSKDSIDIRVLFNPNDSINQQFNDLLEIAKERQKDVLDKTIDNDVCFYLNTGEYQINKREKRNIEDLMAFLVSKKIMINETEYPLDGYANFNKMNDGYHYLEVNNSKLEKIYMQSLNNTTYKEKVINKELGNKYSQIEVKEMDQKLWKQAEQERDFE